MPLMRFARVGRVRLRARRQAHGDSQRIESFLQIDIKFHHTGAGRLFATVLQIGVPERRGS